MVRKIFEKQKYIKWKMTKRSNGKPTETELDLDPTYTNTNSDYKIEMIIFESLLTTFEVSVIFEADGAVAKISSNLKPNQYKQVYQVKIVEILDIDCTMLIRE